MHSLLEVVGFTETLVLDYVERAGITCVEWNEAHEIALERHFIDLA